MFREATLTYTIRIPPAYLSVDLPTTLKTELHNTVSGLVTRESGIILFVTNVLSTGSGRVSLRTGYALFDVVYTAIVCNPQPGQVIDGIIVGASHQGIRIEAGPVDIFISYKCLPSIFNGGFDLNDSSWKSNQGPPQSLRRGTIVRFRIVSTLPSKDLTKMTAVGSLDGQGLGILGSAPV
jgi:DNA-directed RNA polymerase subunit E'/Rpb7